MDPAGGPAGWRPEVGHCFFAVQVARLSPTPSVSASRPGVDFPRLDPGRERHAVDALLDLAGVEHAPIDEVLTREDAIVRDEQIPTKAIGQATGANQVSGEGLVSLAFQVWGWVGR